MKQVSLDTWIQLLGMVGLLGGLIFVGLEMKQSQTIAVAGQTQARNQAIIDFQLGILTSENAASRRLFDRGDINLLDPLDLSQEEYSALRHALNWRANSFQNAFQQYQLGLLDEDVWRQVETRINSQWESCYSRPSLANVTPAFYNYLESKSTKECID